MENFNSPGGQGLHVGNQLVTTLFESNAPQPLADRLRPKRLEDVVGQNHLIAPEAPIGRMLASGHLVSMILWGPPGCGKTTIARLLADRTATLPDAVPAAPFLEGLRDEPPALVRDEVGGAYHRED